MFKNTQCNNIPQFHQLLEVVQDAQVFNRLRTLSFPPVVFRQGAQELPAQFEWQCGFCEKIQELMANGDTCSSIKGKNILSLAGYRPIQRLSDIATIYAMREDRDIDVKTLCWDDLVSIFILSTTVLHNKNSPCFVTLDGSLLEVDDVQSRVKDLQQKLQLPQQTTDSDVRLEV